MKEIITRITIEASPERVWEVLTDIDKYAEWNPFLKQIKGELKLGEKIHVSFHNGMTFHPQIVNFYRIYMLWSSELTKRWKRKYTKPIKSFVGLVSLHLVSLFWFFFVKQNKGLTRFIRRIVRWRTSLYFKARRKRSYRVRARREILRNFDSSSSENFKRNRGKFQEDERSFTSSMSIIIASIIFMMRRCSKGIIRV